MNFIKGRIEANGAGPAFVAGEPPPSARGYDFAGSPKPGQDVVLGVRPEHLEISGPGGGLARLHDRHRRADGRRHGDLVQRRHRAASGPHRRQRKAAPGDRARPGLDPSRSRCSPTPAIGCSTTSRPADPASDACLSSWDIMSVTDLPFNSALHPAVPRGSRPHSRYRRGRRLPLRRDGRLASRRGPEVRAKLIARGLKASSSHVSLAALREKPEAVVDACRDPRPHRPLHARRSARSSATWHADGWRALGRELGGMAERLQETGHPPRLSQSPLGAEAEGRRQDRARADLRGGAGQRACLAGRRRLARARRRRSEGLDDRYRPGSTAAHVKDIAPAGQNEDQDGWADVGAGDARLARSLARLPRGRRRMDGGRARQAGRPRATAAQASFAYPAHDRGYERSWIP